MTSSPAKDLALLTLRRIDPGAHLLACPDAVVIESAPPERKPNGADRDVVLVALAVQCGHGVEAAKFTIAIDLYVGDRST